MADLVLDALHRSLAPKAPGTVVLAVSGGRDSMVLMHGVVAAGLADRVAAVAHFDHRTGDAARRAAAHVAQAAAGLGMPLRAGAADRPMAGADEAAWREARWAFLGHVAAATGGTVATAHTRDDQLETVVFRLLRDAGPRGLASLDTDGGPLRPLLPVPRAAVAAWAAQHHVTWVEDPSNADPRYGRARLRRDLLPALAQAAPDAADALLAVAARAAAWRRDVEAWVSAHVPLAPSPVGTHVAAPWLASYDSRETAVVWPAILARCGVRLDRRGMARVIPFVAAGRSGERVPLGGGSELVRTSDGWVVRHAQPAAPTGALPLTGATRFGTWHFRPVATSEAQGSPWVADLPADRPLTVRAWRDGDRMAGPAGPRRIKRFLADARIPGPLRTGWPVIADGDRILWLPGIRAAASAAGSPTSSLRYVCDRRPV